MPVAEDQHECQDFVSQCCGAGKLLAPGGVCGRCLDHTEFECIDCQALEEDTNEVRAIPLG
jgi:hypothetical protein